MLKLLEQLVEISRSQGVRFVLHFAKCRGKIGIDREIKALDVDGKPGPWPRIFPGVAPQNVVQQCVVKKVEVYKGSQLLGEYRSIEEALSSLR
ncbi:MULTISPECIES: hypothetical protein [Pyrobaculum]|uniref:Uncharacterized protein n=2 Tax=Pyrobaculum arsenaticum TaxID=121277 RepID=A4WGY9_PYRAR|nr:hypothetical protein [Pyrobaculum arsenaticum]ABP49656.1 conserved hypothetical protein [Pyrobaculum arsenaticum DSM 13514]MCY0891097.1 hypothetical protein [Pyrobaculum arsenaticum]NYR15642.1 hypothetical protein [Pyrobaculum arsenaticum]